MSVIERARSYLDKLPPAISGSGGHNAAFHAACILVNGFGLSEPDAFELLSEFNKRCQPEWTARELVHKVRSAMTAQHTKARGYLLNGEPLPATAPLPPPKPQTPPDPVAEITRAIGDFRCRPENVRAASPVPMPSDWRREGVVLIGELYRGGELVNIVWDHRDGRPAGRGLTMQREKYLKKTWLPAREAGAWLRMNPGGIDDADITAFRFCLVELDEVPLPLQLSLFVRLPLPIGAIISSGGKSVHAWVRIDAQDAEEYAANVAILYDHLARFGIDKKNRNPSRLSRLPGVLRANTGRSQRLLFLNPEPTQQPIF